MAGGGSPTYPPPAKRQKKSSATTAASIGDDVLLEIFMHLTSLATLVRAAHTCRAWRRAVASSRDFRRRFRETHPAPLLGLFFDPPGSVQDPALPVFPSFVLSRGSDRDQAAAVRGGDFFLASLQERPGGLHGWDILDCRGGYILDCRGGYILVGNSEKKTMAVLNPMARRSERFLDLGHGHHEEDTLHGTRGFPLVSHDACHLCCSDSEVSLDARLLCSEEDPKSFRVVIVAHAKPSRVRATVFSSDTGEWSVHPWVDVPPTPLPERFKLWLLNSNMQANGMLRWAYNDLTHMLTLDTATMESSVAELPQCVKARECSFVVGETIDGTPCVVYAMKFRVCLFLQTMDGDGVKSQGWLCILATSLRYRFDTNLSWVLSLCLETMQLEKLFQRPHECCYGMASFISW
ncbi:hypothetical protein GQ55_5G252300 [Panicum hallii var. hallii]|uniref:Uncharacterized protein n=1 Tax=Panicum hallii var. hallii TaxID=1504633 RepID=A0A2T7DK19_9POAL|nr:hypothetical protein GQ55_5G252300 [Panicum hallii var. hallii]